MWQKIISILCVINAFNSISDATSLSTDNDTSLNSLYNQLSDLRSDQDKQANDVYFIKAGIETLDGKLKDQDKKIGKINVDHEEKLANTKRDIKFLKMELEQEIEKQKKFINELVVNVTDIQSIKSNITLLKTEFEQNKKNETNYKSDIQSLKQGMEQQGQLINEQRLLIDKQGTSIDDQEMLINEQRMLIEKLGIFIGHLVKEQNTVLHPSNCSEAKSSGIFNIVVSNFSTEPFRVVCDAQTRGGGWTVILKRIDGSVDFYRNWTEYQKGFGDLDGEFFIGLDKLHALTTERTQELLIVFEDFEGNATFAKYDEFAISDEEDKYRLNTLGSYSGTAGDSLDYQRGMQFSTFDNDNDQYSHLNCAEEYTGAWWYNGCHLSQLTGKYKDNDWRKGVNWEAFRGNRYSLKKAIMMIRPRK